MTCSTRPNSPSERESKAACSALFASPRPPEPYRWRHSSSSRTKPWHHHHRHRSPALATASRPDPPSAAAFFRGLFPTRPPPAKASLLRLIADQGRGLETQSDPSRLADIVSCIDALAAVSPGVDTVSDAAKLSGTWRLLWTIVNGDIEVQPPQRVNFRFTRAVLKGNKWQVPFPPFGKGWFDTVYLDDDIRVAKDIRGDYLVVERAPYSWKDSF